MRLCIYVCVCAFVAVYCEQSINLAVCKKKKKKRYVSSRKPPPFRLRGSLNSVIWYTSGWIFTGKSLPPLWFLENAFLLGEIYKDIRICMCVRVCGWVFYRKEEVNNSNTLCGGAVESKKSFLKEK